MQLSAPCLVRVQDANDRLLGCSVTLGMDGDTQGDQADIFARPLGLAHGMTGK